MEQQNTNQTDKIGSERIGKLLLDFSIPAIIGMVVNAIYNIAVINIVLDPIFIFGFDWGIAGAAWATIISQFLSFVWVMRYFNSKRTALRFRQQNMRLERKVVFTILAIGFAPFVMQLAMSLVGIVQNHSLNTYGGDTAVSAMGIVYSIMIVFFMPLQGITQGSQPIIGYNYGAKKYDRVIKTYKWEVIAGTIFITLGWILIQAFPNLFISLFHKEEDALTEMSIYCLRVSTMLFPAIAVLYSFDPHTA